MIRTFFRRFFKVLALLFLILGIVGTVFDLRDQKENYRLMKEYPKVAAKDLAALEGKEGMHVVVKDIHLTGETLTDPRDLLKGDYVYIRAEASVLEKDSEGHAEWNSKSEYSYEVKGKNLKFDAFPDEKFNTDVIHLYNYVDVVKTDNGNTKYTYHAVTPEDTFVAVALWKDGKWEHQKLYDGDDMEYEFGGVDAYYKYLDDFMVGDSYLFVIVGVLFAILFVFISWFFDKKAPKEKEEVEEDPKVAYKDMTSEQKRRFFIFLLLGLLISAFGLYLIISLYYLEVMIVVGTVVLIVGVTLIMSARPSK